MVWPAGLDRSILNGLTLAVRTRNCLLQAQLMDGDSPLTVQQVLRLPNFGRKSLRDLLFTTEGFLNECVRIGSTDLQDTGDTTQSGHPSREAVQRYRRDIQDALDAIRLNRRPHLDSVVWPAGLDRSILNGLTLAVRTRNCLLQAQLMDGDSPLTVQQVLRLPNFGRKSLRDLLFTTEGFLNECVQTGSTDLQDTGEANEYTPNAPKEPGLPTARAQQAPRTPWESAGQLLNPLFTAAADLHGAKTLADTLSPEVMRLAGRMGIANAIGAIRIDHVAKDTPGLVSVTLDRLALTINAASETERTIIEHRLIRTPPTTLEEIGSQVGLTRERIRQIQIKIERKVQAALGREMQIIASVLKEPLGQVVAQSEFEHQIDAILPSDQEFAPRLFRKAVIDERDFTLDSGVYLNKHETEDLRGICASISRLADDVGLVDEQRLIASLPSEEWRRFWPWVRAHSGLCDLFGSLSVRDSGKARVKAALISFGRPATREEIARMCGFSENKMGSHLSVIPSVVKADKDRWGLKEWVDDEYDGIVGEIIQRIEEDGGATTTERVLTELPSKFGVNPISVRAYMQTPKFVIQDGWISLASKSSVQLRDLDDVIDGRDHSGAPYWTFAVEERFFNGNSVPGVPPEFAKALGCAPDAGERVRIDNLPDHPELSIRWPLASTTGASLGYLAEPLQTLGLKPGQRVRVAIKGPRRVELIADDGSAEHPQGSEANAILERIMKRRKVL